MRALLVAMDWWAYLPGSFCWVSQVCHCWAEGHQPNQSHCLQRCKGQRLKILEVTGWRDGRRPESSGVVGSIHSPHRASDFSSYQRGDTMGRQRSRFVEEQKDSGPRVGRAGRSWEGLSLKPLEATRRIGGRERLTSEASAFF